MSEFDRLRRRYQDEPTPRAPAPGKVPTSAKIFRASRDHNGVAPGADEAVARASSSSGSPLPESARAKFESSLGADLSAVRVHTGASSADAAAAVGAKAYTIGNDIHFAEGQYSLDPFGIHLLAHEVAHTQQQAGGTPHRQNKLEVSAPGDSAEVDADRAADAMVAGARASITVGGAGIQREEEEESESGGSQASFTWGERTTAFNKSKDGKKSTLTHAKEIEIPGCTIEPHQLCAEPPLFFSGGLVAKVMAGIDAKEGEDGEIESNTVSGTVSLELSGKLLLGAAAKKLGKVGLEGAVTGSISLPGKVTVTKEGKVQVPKDLVADVLVEVTLGLVGEVGHGEHKIGGALTKNLSSLKLGVVTLNDSGIDFKICKSEAVAQAAKDLLWNTAETVLPGGAQIQQYEIDKKNEEKLAKSSAQDVKKSDASIHDQQVSAQNNEIGNSMAEGSTAIAGMTRGPDGTYHGEYTPEQKAAVDNEEAAKVRANVKEKYASWEQRIAKLRSDASAAKGKCNGLMSGGGAAVKPAAQAAYSQGFAKCNEAEQDWKIAQAAASSTGTDIFKFFPHAQAAAGEFDDAIDKFHEGDQLQGSGS